MKKEIKVHYYFDDKDYSNEESSYIIAKFITKLAEIKNQEINEELVRQVFLSALKKFKKRD